MLNLSLPEAQLMRMLSGFFGPEQVIPAMSVMAVCSGELPKIDSPTNGFDLESWAKSTKCLFTVVDANDVPRLVVELGYSTAEIVDVIEIEKTRYLPELFSKVGVSYVTVSMDEMDLISDPSNRVNIVTFLLDKFGISPDEASPD